MAQRRSRRTAAAAAESRIARAVEDESEDSNGSNYGADNNSVSSSDDEADATIEEESDTEFIPEEAEVSSKSSKSKANKKGSKATKAAASKKTNKTATTSSSSTTANPVNASVTSKDKDSSDNAKELSDDSLKCLIRNFRLTDLQALMIYVGKNKAGRKNEMLVCNTFVYFLSRVSPSGPENYSSYFCNFCEDSLLFIFFCRNLFISGIFKAFGEISVNLKVLFLRSNFQGPLKDFQFHWAQLFNIIYCKIFFLFYELLFQIMKYYLDRYTATNTAILYPNGIYIRILFNLFLRLLFTNSFWFFLKLCWATF